ncbi:WecB/TagA/CpsF family glycosyltransferase [Desulfosporosinus sp. Sb-LF]|uniref:WecB/TagA/CpsF family glycosyltransferase n=1 Tax=Desulfosporosinus sp. Sb-LF TaxID=2560027 RepID=UPI00107FC696|nr:WecB/TagA/CpsF family glycosyltransferase [Desulfosporosinus sp. Sb-LF]TGE31902.1 glycosyltransferase [Desulfosporosinus sp. Sb-LF]
MPRIDFLNTKIDNVSMEEAVDSIASLIQENNSAYVVTPNLDHIVILEKDDEFAKVYKNADLILADGKPLIWISKLLGTSIKEKVSGSDIFPEICQMAAMKGYSIYILGAANGVAAKAAANLKEQYMGLNIVGTYSPPFGFEKNTNELEKIRKLITEANPDILAVSLGSPKGEKFIYHHLHEYSVPLSISIGATIDFEAGNVKRAPKWMSKVGLEWLYRTIKEPKRLAKRYWNDAVSIVPIIIKCRNK